MIGPQYQGCAVREQSIFTEALEKTTPAERAAYLDQACAGDPVLRERVERLLARHEEAGSFLERLAAQGPDVTTEAAIREGPGTIIGSYKLLEQIGEGGFGVVFMAEQTQPIRRKVALKILKPGMDTRQVVARFEAERQALALMEHPNIARVLDGGETATGRPFFVMELIRGVPITEYCDQHQLPVNQRLELFADVCKAVRHAHQKGIIHRDIKPSNVLITMHDGTPVAKVIDFGVAKAMGQQLTDRTLFTNFVQMVGTPLYMSPEQAEMSGLDIDTRADIYALGVLLYELLTGTTPFDRERLGTAAFDEIRRIIREEEPAKPSTRISTLGDKAPSVSAVRKSDPSRLSRLLRGELDWIVMKCLEKDRTRRYETANGLARDVLRYLNDEAVEAGPPSATYRLRKFAHKHRRVLGAAGVLALVLAMASGVSIWQAVRATRAENTAVDEKNRADDEAAIAKAVNEFLQKDLLGQADIGNQPSGTERNKDIKVRDLLDRAAQRIEGKFAGKELTEAAIRLTLGKAYLAIGEFPEAQTHIERSLRLRREKLGAEHRDSLESLSELANVRRFRTDHGEAERLYKEVLEGRRAILGADHPDTLQTTSDLGMMYCYNARYDEAEPLLNYALETRRTQLGPDHLDTLVCKYHMAQYCQERRRYEDGERLYNQVLTGRHAQLGADHPLTLETMNALASHYRSWGKFVDSESLFMRVIETQRAKLGGDHPETLNTLQNLSALYYDQKRYGEAETLMKQVDAGMRARLGPESSATLQNLGNLGTLYNMLGRHNEAIPILKEVLDKQRRKLTADDPEVLISAHNLGCAYRDAGRYDEAEPLLLEAAGGLKKKLGLSDPLTQTAINNLAKLHTRQGKPALSEPNLREAAAFHRQHSGPESQACDDQLAYLFVNLIDQERFADAEQIARERLAIRFKNITDLNLPGAWSLFLMKSDVGEALLGQKKYADAEPLLLEGYEGMKARKQHMGHAANNKLVFALELLVKLYDAWGKEAEAERWRKELADEKARGR